MKLSFSSVSLVVVICFVLLASVMTGPTKHWRPADSRCGNIQPKFRLGRSVTSNNSGNFWRFNGNTGSCERYYGNPKHDRVAFETKRECDQACLNGT